MLGIVDEAPDGGDGECLEMRLSIHIRVLRTLIL
jgi:hypothetical protein